MVFGGSQRAWPYLCWTTKIYNIKRYINIKVLMVLIFVVLHTYLYNDSRHGFPILTWFTQEISSFLVEALLNADRTPNGQEHSKLIQFPQDLKRSFWTRIFASLVQSISDIKERKGRREHSQWRLIAIKEVSGLECQNDCGDQQLSEKTAPLNTKH